MSPLDMAAEAPRAIPPIMTVKGVQQFIPVSKATLYKLINSGELRSFCPPGVRRRFISRKALEEFIQTNDVSSDEVGL